MPAHAEQTLLKPVDLSESLGLFRYVKDDSYTQKSTTGILTITDLY